MVTFAETLMGAFRLRATAKKRDQNRKVTLKGESQLNPSQGSIKRNGITNAEESDLYQPGRSFIDQCPWVEAIEGEDAILLEDNRSIGVVYEFMPLGTEGRTEEYLAEIRDSLETAFQDVFDEYDEAPWVVQTYTFAEPSLDAFMQEVEAYVRPGAKGTRFTTEYLALLQKHYRGICKRDGLFFDDEVTKTPWGGCVQRNYLVIYRRLPERFRNEDQRGGLTTLEAVNETCEKLFNSIAPMGIRERRLTGAEFHRWMTCWFNQRTDLDRDDPNTFASLIDHDDQSLPFGNEFVESMFYSYPRSDIENRCWHFDRSVTRCLTVDGIRKRPAIGQTTGETRTGDAINTMMDQLPPGTVMVSTIVIVPHDTTESRIDGVAKSAIGDAADAMRTRADCQSAKEIIGQRHNLHRVRYGFLVTASSVNALNKVSNRARAVLLAHGFRAVAVRDDIRALDNYLLHLPMKYDPERDRAQNWRNAQLTWVQHIINLSCLFGRSRGTGNPGALFFNRGGEPLVWDPLNKHDRNKNAHMFMLGPTGAGKSVTLSNILTHTLAMYRPRLFVIEAGNSFGLTAEWYRSLGLTVNVVSLKPGSAVTLPTYADAHLILDTAAGSADREDDAFGVDDDDEEVEDVQRDILGEMEIIATLMITGGEESEEALLRRSDRRVIRDAILTAARTTRESGAVTQTEHVRDAFYTLSENRALPEGTRQRIREMGDAIGLFTDGFTGEVFNTPGEAWPEVDVTLIDLAHFARENYEAHLAISVISLLNMINNLAERDQHTDREIVVAIDEAHIITTNPLLAPYLAKIVKMWRKLGAWLWLATQNMQDFPGVAKKLLNMIEWWVCLVMPKQEVEEIERFRQLSGEQCDMLLSASKADRKFTEGVVLSKNLEVLFRSVPPSLLLSLAMTEKHEKAERAGIMREHNVSEVGAAKIMAERIDQARGIE